MTSGSDVPRRRARRAALALAGAGLALALPVPLVAAPAQAAAPAATRSRAPSPVRITVEDVTPSTPAITKKARPLTVSLTLQNTTPEAIDGVTVTAERPPPLTTQRDLDAALSSTKPPADSIPITATPPVKVNLPAGSSVSITFRTSSGLNDDAALCLCHKAAVYALYFTAQSSDSVGALTPLGSAHTFVPAFQTPPTPAQVSWIWPLIDRPHRLARDSVFTDDDLADSVRSGGRLDRALAVAEDVAPDVPLTLLVDPELLDELEVMATTRYTVRVGTKSVPGTGTDDARAWLKRFGDVLRHTDVDVQLTPYADPDVQSLTDRRLSWSRDLPPAMALRVSTALAGRAATNTLAWPPGGRVSPATFRAMSAYGVNSIVLDASSVQTGGKLPPTRAHMSSGPAEAQVAITSSAVEKYVAQAVTLGGAGTRVLPQLVAEVAIRAVEANLPAQPSSAFLAITAPRYVDASPVVAARVIRDTSRSLFATPVSLADALDSTVGLPGVRLVRHPKDRLPTALTDAERQVRDELPAAADLLMVGTKNATAGADPLVSGMGTGLQRLVSAAWRTDSGLGGPKAGTALAQRLQEQVQQLLGGVHIVRPASRNYTLASRVSDLPIAVRNDSDYAMKVVVSVTTVSGLPGLTTTPRTAVIPAHARVTVKVQTKVDRVGSIPVEVQLSTPGDVALGLPVRLLVHSNALGTIGVVITAIAGGVLLLALLVRLVGRLRARRPWPRPVTTEPDLDEVTT